MRENLRCAICACLSIFFAVQMVNAQIKGNPQLKSIPTQNIAPKISSKLSPDLKKLYDKKYGPGALRAESTAKPLPNNVMDNLMQIQGDKVVIDVTAREDINTAKSELQKMGLQVTGVFGRVISGLMPISTLSQLEASTSIKFARPAYKPMLQSINKLRSLPPGKKITPVISQGDTAQRSEIARKKYKVDGKGVKVGILSDSYNNLGTADIGVKNGELPGPGNPFNFKKPVQVLQDLSAGGTDEGRGMAEIVHDVAPGAELAFTTSSLGQASFAQGIQNLAANGCNIITDDALYFAEPFFQDGIITQSVDLAKKKGVTYISAAGNQGVRSYESPYRPSLVEPLGPGSGTAHNFSAAGDPPRYFQPIYIPTNGSMILSFQWDQSSFTASGVGAETDFDIYLLDNDGNIVSGAASDNIASGDPIEVFGYRNNTPNVTFYLLIVKFAGPDVSRLKYVLFDDPLFYLTDPPIPGILAPTLYGHPKGEGAIATGAAFYLQTPAYGVDTPQVEFFSSEGGIPNYFDIAGNRIDPLIRKKPDITSPDGGNTSFFDPFGNGDIPQDTDTFPNFFGTSAAAPHAAGVAALMIEAQKLKTITPDQIRGVLMKNAIDMDNVYTDGFDKGFDFNTGAGFIQADKSVGEVKFPNVFIKDLKLKAQCSDDPSVTRDWKIINPNPFDVEANWYLVGSSQHGTINVPPGDATFSTNTISFGNSVVPNIVIIDWQDNFGFARFDASTSSKAKCGKDVATDGDDGKELTGMSIEDISKPKIAEVYPNPSTNNFKLYLSLGTEQPTDIELYSIDGRKLYASRVTQSTGVFDIGAVNYKPGMYILKVRQGDFNKVFKLIKQ